MSEQHDQEIEPDQSVVQEAKPEQQDDNPPPEQQQEEAEPVQEKHEHPDSTVDGDKGEDSVVKGSEGDQGEVMMEVDETAQTEPEKEVNVKEEAPAESVEPVRREEQQEPEKELPLMTTDQTPAAVNQTVFSPPIEPHPQMAEKPRPLMEVKPLPLMEAKPPQTTSDYYSASDATKEEEVSMATGDHADQQVTKANAEGFGEVGKACAHVIDTM